MRTTFICLANSRKHGERCIAGVEIQPDPQTQQYQLVKDGGMPHWIRPVTETDYGQIPAQLVENIHLLDVINLENRGNVPTSSQKENFLFEPQSIAIQTKLAPTVENLDALTEGAPLTLFGNRGKAVSAAQIAEVNYSLLFVKVRSPEFYAARLGHQLRAKFVYNSNNYDFPVTDVQFCEQYYKNPKVLDDAKNVYFTLSLGMLHEDWHYKLVAGVFTAMN
jgi:hypothetical protein